MSSKKGRSGAASSSSSPLDPTQVLTAARALLAFVNKKNAQAQPAPLFTDEEKVHVVFTLCKIPDVLSKTALAVPLLHDVSAEPKVCIFARGKGTEAKELVERLGIQAKVIGIKKMERKYSPFEMRRKLAASYDLFLCDATIAKPLIPLCGKIFYKRHKMPLSVTLDEKLGDAVTAARRSTSLIPSKGVCWVVRVASTGHEARVIGENAVNAINWVVKHHVVGGWDNIQSVHLKSDTSAALPVFAAAPRPGLVIEGASVPVVPSKRVDPDQPDSDADDAELRALADEAGLDWISSEDGDAGEDAAVAAADEDDEEEEEEEEQGEEQPAKLPKGKRERKGRSAPAAVAAASSTSKTAKSSSQSKNKKKIKQ